MKMCNKENCQNQVKNNRHLNCNTCKTPEINTVYLCPHVEYSHLDELSHDKCPKTEICTLADFHDLCQFKHIQEYFGTDQKQFKTITIFSLQKIKEKINTHKCYSCSRGKCTLGMTDMEELCPGYMPGALTISPRKRAIIMKQNGYKGMPTLDKKEWVEWSEENMWERPTYDEDRMAKLVDAKPELPPQESMITHTTYPILRPIKNNYTLKLDRLLEQESKIPLLTHRKDIDRLRGMNTFYGYDELRYQEIKDTEALLRSERRKAAEEITGLREVNQNIRSIEDQLRKPNQSFIKTKELRKNLAELKQEKINITTQKLLSRPAKCKSSQKHWRDIKEASRRNKFMRSHGERLMTLLELEPDHPITLKLSQVDYDSLALVV